MAELLDEFEERLESVTLIPSDGGTFEVSLDGELLYSKVKSGRHAGAGEVAGLVRARLGAAEG